MKNASIWNKLLNGMLRKNECNNEELFKFLKLFKQLDHRRNKEMVEISVEIFISMVKCTKKQNISLVFSGRIYAVYKCIILCNRMLSVLVIFYNIILKQKYYLVRWIKILETIIEKGKELVIGKLWNI